jgi:hypothetical protein
MELTTDQEAKFRDLCKEIKPGEYGRVVVSFVGEPTNLVNITAEKTFRFRTDYRAIREQTAGTLNAGTAGTTQPDNSKAKEE